LHFALPGVPDIYQGTELHDFSLVDPDNRRPVDYGVRRAAITDPSRLNPEDRRKFSLIRGLLGARRQAAGLFADGDFEPLEVSGARQGHVFAFVRRLGRQSLSCAVVLNAAGSLAGRARLVPPPAWWGDTTIAAANGQGRLAASAVFAEDPVYFDVQI